MSSKTTNSKGKVNPHSLVNFPEEVDEKNHIKIYGETSYENQIAVLSHYLHNSGEKLSKKRRKEIISAIHTFLEQKKDIEPIEDYENLVTMAAEDPAQYSFFSGPQCYRPY